MDLLPNTPPLTFAREMSLVHLKLTAMNTKFSVISSEKLEHGGFNTHLVSETDGFVAGLSYWVKTTKELEIGKSVELNMDLYTVSTEVNKAHQDKTIRVIRPKY